MPERKRLVEEEVTAVIAPVDEAPPLNDCSSENLLLSERRVVEATVMVPPSETEAPLMVMLELARSVFCTVAQVATPEPLSERTNWLVQLVPVYAMVPPVELARWSAEVMLVMARLVVVAEVEVAFWVMRLPAESMVVEAVAPKDAVFAVSRPEKVLVVEALVAVSPPLKAMLVVVAFRGKRYAKVDAR